MYEYISASRYVYRSMRPDAAKPNQLMTPAAAIVTLMMVMMAMVIMMICEHIISQRVVDINSRNIAANLLSVTDEVDYSRTI